MHPHLEYHRFASTPRRPHAKVLGAGLTAAISAAPLLFFLSACEPGAPPPSVATTSEPLVAHLGRLWQTPLGSGVPVCWEDVDETDDFSRQRALVEEAIEQTWSREAGIRFVGWGPCSPDSAGVRIGVGLNERSGPHCRTLGTALDAVPWGCTLALHADHIPYGLRTRADFRPALSDGRLTDEAIAGLAVHELGHALGFAHEQDGFAEQCSAATWFDPLHVALLDRYDRDSVMNYCRSRRFAPRPLNQILSDGDKRAARMLYPLDGRNACAQDACPIDIDGSRSWDLCTAGWDLGCVPATGECLQWQALPEGAECQGPMYRCVDQSCVLSTPETDR